MRRSDEKVFESQIVQRKKAGKQCFKVREEKIEKIRNSMQVLELEKEKLRNSMENLKSEKKIQRNKMNFQDSQKKNKERDNFLTIVLKVTTSSFISYFLMQEFLCRALSKLLGPIINFRQEISHSTGEDLSFQRCQKNQVEFLLGNLFVTGYFLAFY